MQNKSRQTYRTLILWDLNISDIDSQNTKNDVCLLFFSYYLQNKEVQLNLDLATLKIYSKKLQFNNKLLKSSFDSTEKLLKVC